MSNFLQRLDRIERALSLDCRECSQPIEAETTEEFLTAWFRKCSVCGREKTFAELSVRAAAELAIEGLSDAETTA